VTLSAAQPAQAGNNPLSPGAPTGAEAGAADSLAADRAAALQDAIDGLAKHKSVETLALYGDSLDLWIREDQRFMEAVKVRLSELNKGAKFCDDRRLLWIEPPYSPEGRRSDVHHYRLFCDEHWQPIKPRGEVYSTDFTEKGWKSFSELHANDELRNVVHSMGEPG